MLKQSKLLSLVIISFLIPVSAAHACNSVPSSFHWPSGWEEVVKQMPTKSAKAQYSLSDKVRTFKIKRIKVKNK